MEMVIKRLSVCLSLDLNAEDCQYACHLIWTLKTVSMPVTWFECWRLSVCLSLLIWVLKTVSMSVTVDLSAEDRQYACHCCLSAEDCQYVCHCWSERWRLSVCLSLLIWALKTVRMSVTVEFELWRLSVCLSLLIWALKTVSMLVTVDVSAEDCQDVCHCWFERWRLSVCLSLLIWALMAKFRPTVMVKFRPAAWQLSILPLFYWHILLTILMKCSFITLLSQWVFIYLFTKPHFEIFLCVLI